MSVEAFASVDSSSGGDFVEPRQRSGRQHPNAVFLRPSSGTLGNDVFLSEAVVLEHWGRTYPRWLNITAVPVLLSIPVGLIVAVLGAVEVGIVVSMAGFLGLWIFGSIATKTGRNKWQVKRVDRVGGAT